MRPLARRAFTALSALSLVLCVAAAAVWVRSLYFEDTVARMGERSAYIRTSRGLFMLYWCGSDLRSPHGWRHGSWDLQGISSPWDDLHGWPGRAGFDYGIREHFPGQLVHKAVVPAYAVVLTTAIAPASWMLRRRRSTRRQCAGLCPHCDYDLRASPDRCPECGAASAAAADAPRDSL